MEGRGGQRVHRNRCLHCKGSDYGGGVGGGGGRGVSSRARFLLGCDPAVDRGAVVPVDGFSASSWYSEREATAVAAVAVEGEVRRWRAGLFVW